MAKYLVDEVQTSSRTIEVEANSEAEAQERYPDTGVVVSSETSAPQVEKISLA